LASSAMATRLKLNAAAKAARVNLVGFIIFK
jgi:hypothetical protein